MAVEKDKSGAGAAPVPDMLKGLAGLASAGEAGQARS